MRQNNGYIYPFSCLLTVYVLVQIESFHFACKFDLGLNCIGVKIGNGAAPLIPAMALFQNPNGIAL